MLPPLFNPSNDMALASGLRQYFPPKRIQQMEDDLAELAEQWDEGPWGWSLATKLRYEKMGVDRSELPTDEWINSVRALSSREYACNYIQHLLNEIRDERLVGSHMRFCTNAAEGLSKGDEAMIYKLPWSSSGRGIFTSHKLSAEQIKEKLAGYVRTQGGFVADRFYADKILDFAMEFMVGKNHKVDFLGYSVFHAEEGGAYGYNLVESQESLRALIGVDEELLQRLIAYHKEHLGKTDYHGPVGIDMLKVRTGNGYALHPVIEINMRMNMGILAIILYSKYGQNASVKLTKEHEHGFEAHLTEGKLQIIYKK